MNSRSHFVALLTFCSTNEGGKETPVSSGYRAMIQFPFDQSRLLAIQNYPDVELVFAGDTVTAEITMLNSDAMDKIYEGLDFDFYEAETMIGHGVVTGVL